MVSWMGKRGQNSKWYFTKIAQFENVMYNQNNIIGLYKTNYVRSSFLTALGALYWKQTIFQYFQYRSLTANSANLSFRNSLKQVGFTKPSVLEVLYCLTWIYIYLWPKIPNGRTLTACWVHCNFKRAKKPISELFFSQHLKNSSDHDGIIKHPVWQISS